MHESKQAMYAAHPLTDLDCYDTDGPVGSIGPSRRLAWGATATAIAACVPAEYWSGFWSGWLLWAAALTTFVLVALAGRRRHGEGVVGHRGQLVSVAVILWLLAGLAGATGWVLIRLPLILIAGSLALWRRREIAEANRFPARLD